MAAVRAVTRVLFVVPQGAYFITHRLQLATAALAAGYDVHVALPSGDSHTSVVREAGIVVHELPLDRRSVNPLSEARLLGALVALYRRQRPDIVHHVTIKPVMYGTVAARIARVPAVVNAITGLGYLFIGDGVSGSIKRATAIAAYRLALRHRNQRAIFMNDDDRRTFVANGIVTHEETVMIAAGAGVDLSQFAPADEPPGVPLVVLPARMLWHKGVGEFVKAARTLREEGLSVRFALVGGTDENRASVPEQQLREWHTEGVVEWWGRRDDMPVVFARSTIVCLPSYREGVPKALLEASASGRAIVTTNAPGCRDVIRDDDNGLVVPVGDARALAIALRRLLTIPAERRRMAARALERARTEFDIALVIAATFAVYETLLHAQAGT